jgi:hypothetical protein
VWVLGNLVWMSASAATTERSIEFPLKTKRELHYDPVYISSIHNSQVIESA